MNKINYISLKVKCPKCGISFMDSNHKIDNEPGIKLSIKASDKSGTIWLSSIYGDYNHESDITIPADSIVTFSCPHCKAELNTTEICDICRAQMVTLILDMGGKVSFCSRKGCAKHMVGFEDLSEALKKLYQHFDFGS